jgi:aspartate/methionine/tyrosine aminotransferase
VNLEPDSYIYEEVGSAPFVDFFSKLTSYGRTLEYYRLMFFEGPFATLRDSFSVRPEVELIDQINFSGVLHDDPLPLNVLIDHLSVEPGYGTPDGSHEMGPFIKHIESCRADRYAGEIGVAPEGHRDAIAKCAVGVGNGVTGTLTNLLGAIVRSRRHHSSNLVLVSPNYCIAEEIARLYQLETRMFRCSEGSSFLPNVNDLRRHCDHNTAAICLTIPTNPSHDMWRERAHEVIQEIIEFCKGKDIFLVLDTIFQDTGVGGEVIPEPFVISQSNECLAKVFGPSKDRPFACGHRIGYYIGDTRLHDNYQHISHITLNSPNFYAKLWFAFELLFRTAWLAKRKPAKTDYALFNDSFLLGEQFRRVSGEEIECLIEKLNLFERYSDILNNSNETVRQTMAAVHNFAQTQPALSTRPLPNFGNSLYIRVNPGFYAGTDHDFFWEIFSKLNVGLLVGNSFGMEFPSREIWFRVVCVAENSETLIERVSRVASFLQTDSAKY